MSAESRPRPEVASPSTRDEGRRPRAGRQEAAVVQDRRAARRAGSAARPPELARRGGDARSRRASSSSAKTASSSTSRQGRGPDARARSSSSSGWYATARRARKSAGPGSACGSRRRLPRICGKHTSSRQVACQPSRTVRAHSARRVPSQPSRAVDPAVVEALEQGVALDAPGREAGRPRRRAWPRPHPRPARRSRSRSSISTASGSAVPGRSQCARTPRRSSERVRRLELRALLLDRGLSVAAARGRRELQEGALLAVGGRELEHALLRPRAGRPGRGREPQHVEGEVARAARLHAPVEPALRLLAELAAREGGEVAGRELDERSAPLDEVRARLRERHGPAPRSGNARGPPARAGASGGSRGRRRPTRRPPRRAPAPGRSSRGCARAGRAARSLQHEPRGLEGPHLVLEHLHLEEPRDQDRREEREEREQRPQARAGSRPPRRRSSRPGSRRHSGVARRQAAAVQSAAGQRRTPSAGSSATPGASAARVNSRAPIRKRGREPGARAADERAGTARSTSKVERSAGEDAERPEARGRASTTGRIGAAGARAPAPTSERRDGRRAPPRSCAAQAKRSTSSRGPASTRPGAARRGEQACSAAAQTA